jgi:CheY-like chemotaxis protein
MNPETQARIFEPFFTTRERYKGTGLGLSCVHGIVKQSGGFIWVNSEPGHGSTFRIYLPKAERQESEAVFEGLRGDSPQGSETILIVEDDAVVRRVVKRILINFGYQTLEAADSNEALGICEEYPGPIHLLLTDVIMPGMNGRDLAARWAASRPQTKIIFTSGYTEDTIALQGNLEAGIHFLQKPYRPDYLARKIREVLD